MLRIILGVVAGPLRDLVAVGRAEVVALPALEAAHKHLRATDRVRLAALQNSCGIPGVLEKQEVSKTRAASSGVLEKQEGNPRRAHANTDTWLLRMSVGEPDLRDTAEALEVFLEDVGGVEAEAVDLSHDHDL
eukprot:CAMPEP_0179310418 /NCGR_PEP_ID=MMETSP0797-20121207/52156_1 /TAXON_ID=47934 /ORGANISM="Dinophysis acuminata, Strain DAEP01" /LENGTH=132 /DNA_ID=CAMNT_0021020151 /DNA_START=402 /DNA_END=796 /DNA_ORIENTATION=+